MIRAGRKTLDAEGVALAHGYGSLRTAQRAKLFANPTLPKAVNDRGEGPKRGKKQLWDEQQIHAHATGTPIPALPDTDDPDDLLDHIEAAPLWGIEPATWHWYHREKPQLIPAVAETVSGIPHWRRGDITSFLRPGKGDGAGRPPGIPESGPRTPRPQDERAEQRRQQVAEMLADARAREVTLTAETVAQDLGVSADHARRLIRDARGS